MTPENFINKLKPKLCSLYSGIFSDILDSRKYYNCVAINWNCNNKTTRLLGLARTVDIRTEKNKKENIELGLTFLESCGSNDILVVNGSSKYAYFGELMSRLSIRSTIKGVIINGLTRDSNYTCMVGNKLPIFSKGYSPIDIKGRGYVKNVDVPIKIENINVLKKQVIFADNDGIVFIPKDLSLSTLYSDILKSIKNEEDIKKKIKNGISVSKLLIDHDEF